jgi:hypothetical protein
MKHLLSVLLVLFALPAYASTWYVDYVNGNDANAGTSFAAAWKTVFTNIQSGDTVRIAKSPDPTSLGVVGYWISGSRTLTLTNALTANISQCNTSWIPVTATSANVDTSVRKEGSASVKVIIPGSAGTGRVAYMTNGNAAVDFSAYKQVSFWVLSSSVITNSTLSLRLCSDTLGLVSVQTITIPAIGSANRWVPITVNIGSALPVAVSSFALYQDVDNAVIRNFWLDNIIACKDSTSTNALTLTSLVGKNTTAEPEWYPIGSINDTVVMIDNDTLNVTPTTGRGYYGPGGVSEAVTTYKRETIKTDMVNATTTVGWGWATNSNITYLGGWNTTGPVLDGATFYDGQSGFGYGFRPNGKTNSSMSNIGFVRYNIGFDGAAVTGNNDWQMTNCAGVGCTANAFTISTSYRCQLVNCYGLNSGGANLSMSAGGRNKISGFNFSSGLSFNTIASSCSENDFKSGRIDNNTSYGIYLASGNNSISSVNFFSNSTYGILYDGGGETLLYSCVSSNNATSATSSLNPANRPIYFNCTFYDAIIGGTASAIDITGYNVFSDNHNNTATNSRIINKLFTIYQDLTNARPSGASAASWAVKSSNVLVTSAAPPPACASPRLCFRR